MEINGNYSKAETVSASSPSSESSSSSSSSSTRTLLFVYGTLKRGQPNQGVMTERGSGQATLIGTGITGEKWPLVIASRYNVPYLLNYPGTGHHIRGEVWSVDQEKLHVLDKFENYPDYYDRLPVLVHLLDQDDEKNGQEVRPMLYVLKTFKPDLLNLPLHSDYDSYGSHDMPYHERLIRTGNEEATDVMPVIRRECLSDIH